MLTLVCKQFDQLLIVSGMCRRYREILCSFSKEEKMPKLSEDKPSPVVAADDDDGDADAVVTNRQR